MTPQPTPAPVMPRFHGVPPRGLLNTPRQVSYDGRFGRLFQGLDSAHDPTSPEDEAALRTIADSMRETDQDSSSDNPAIPSGYTYLGQFVDHDLTFDPTSTLQRRNDEEGLINFRTPRFDLDSIYGSGPVDEPFQYDQTLHGGLGLLLDARGAGFDMPRNRQDVALIGDPRNDENGIVSQLHVAFLALHNRLLDLVAREEGLSGQALFDRAQRLAQWHYQWVVVHDFLRRIIGQEMHQRLLTEEAEPGGGTREVLHLRFYRHKRNPYLPVEFSVAAYRYGHSQVRDRYSINRSFNRRVFDPNGDDFRGFQPLRPGWHASWPFFFEIDGQPPQPSRAIDTRLASTLFELQGDAPSDANNLALLNLRRGAALGLPSGQAVAEKLKVEALADAELAPAAAGRVPLWFYVLREAEVVNHGRHLGPVGGRIVGETLLGLLRADPQSYYAIEPTWQPTLPAKSGSARDFDMMDLLQFAVPAQCSRF